jgi:hypothetical protein
MRIPSDPATVPELIAKAFGLLRGMKRPGPQKSAIFLDVDKVLNTEADRHGNGYNGICPQLARNFNLVLEAAPDALIVVSSSWRYHVLSGRMKPDGLRELLCHFGLDLYGRNLAVTAKDPYHWGDRRCDGWTEERWHSEGIAWRVQQIRGFVARHKITRFVVFDDLPLELPELIQTNESTGLTIGDVERAVKALVA